MAEAATKLEVKTTEKKPAEGPVGAALPTAWPFGRLRREMDRLFDDFELGSWRSPLRALADVEPFFRGEVTWGKVPAVDVADTAAAYEITAELPGMDEKDIEVKFADGTLTIKGEKKKKRKSGRRTTICPNGATARSSARSTSLMASKRTRSARPSRTAF